jgi:hypothetical protein
MTIFSRLYQLILNSQLSFNISYIKFTVIVEKP